VARKITAFVKVDPKSLELKPGFTRDVTDIGHYGTGDLEITIDSDEDFEEAKPLFAKSYEAS
jgi:predicted transport protein